MNTCMEVDNQAHNSFCYSSVSGVSIFTEGSNIILQVKIFRTVLIMIDKLQSTLYNRAYKKLLSRYREGNVMKSEEALEQISYMKDLLAKSRIKATEGYPVFLLVGIFWFIGNILIITAHTIPFLNFLWVFFVIAAAVSVRALVRNHKWPVMDLKLLKQLGSQCLFLLISSIPFGVLLFNLSANWAFKAYVPFQVGLAYMIAGVFIGRDMKYIGLGIAATSLLSLLMPYPFQDIWLAVVGGGGLAVTGVIFRNQVKKRG